MCGIIGVYAPNNVFQVTLDGLSMLQHRGQDAAGIATCSNDVFYLHKDNGMITDVFDNTHMARMQGNFGLGHVRYPTAGCSSVAESQPFYVNAPYGIMLVHNGNLTNSIDLLDTMRNQYYRHINTSSDSEILLNVFAHALSKSKTAKPTIQDIFDAIEHVHKTCKGGYATIGLIAGVGMIAFRDPNGIRPLCYGHRINDNGNKDYMMASESSALDINDFTLDGDIAPGEAIFINTSGEIFRESYAGKVTTQYNSCLFEYVYLSRPDSVLDGVSVYESRALMGVYLARKIMREWEDYDFDVIVPIPETSRTAAIEMARRLNIPMREGFVKNRYVGRTFIMPGQNIRSQSVRRKLNPIKKEFTGKRVLLVDDSIVRGTTSRKIVQKVREMGAEKVYLASAAPEVRYPNVYGIDMPSEKELIASNNKSLEDIQAELGCDKLIYQNLSDLKKAITKCNPDLTSFDDSVFTGHYVTQDIDITYLQRLDAQRNDAVKTNQTETANIVRNMTPNIHRKSAS